MADDILKEAKEGFELAAEREADNRKEALDDLRFARLAEQWPDAVKKSREREGRPCLTINRLPAFIRQIVNDARQNKPAIKVHPADSLADVKTAEIYNGLIRNIEVSSRAGIVYDTALDSAVTMGFGYFRINTEYACDDSFDLDLVLKRIANPFSVYGDPYSAEADSSDWNTAFITQLMSREQFRSQYKGAAAADWDAGGYDTLQEPWREDERVLVAEYFRRDPIKKAILLLSDQSVVDEAVFAANRDEYDAAGITVAGTRSAQGHRVTQRILTGAEVLEENKWAGKYIPVVPVYGDEVNVEGKRHFRSLVRDAKDPARMFNFWRTASTELVALAPKAPFIGPRGSFTTDAAKWATANVESHAFIEYDDRGAPPQRQAFAGVPAGALQEALNAADDMKAIIGIYDASLGAPSNETSGRAILARQREGDVSTFHFIDNLSRAIEHAGRILIDLIPLVYKGERMVRVLGPQGAVSTVKLNVPVPMPSLPPTGSGGESLPPIHSGGNVLSHVYDLARGKYDLTVETGPSFTTRREEAASQMTELIRAYPAAAPVLGDLLAKNLDWPDADEIAKRLQALLPPAVNGAGNAQASALVQRLQQQIALLTAQLQGVQNDRTLDAEKLRIDSYKAETDRLKMQTEIARQNGETFGAPSTKPYGVGGGGDSDFRSSGSIEGENEGPSFAPPPNPDNVYSVNTGKVTRAGWENPNNPNAGLGWRVWITESDGSQMGYGHMDPRTTPPMGTPIEAGDHIGNFANPTNGRSDGPHVHVQRLDRSGKLADPGTISPLINGRITTRFGRNIRDPLHPSGHSGIDWARQP